LTERQEVSAGDFVYSPADFEQIRRRLYAQTGINLASSKAQMVYSRLSRRLRALRISSFADYLAFLADNPREQEEFVNALTTNLTAFFREAHHFAMLENYAREFARAGRYLRCWCAATSTGEEAYSIAMTLIRAYDSYSPPVEILASDIDSRVLEQAKAGIYSLAQLEKLDSETRRLFFQRGRGSMAGRARIRPQLTELIRFERINLLDTSWPLKEPFHVIFCRNVMIYFDKPTQFRLLERMLDYLADDGLYFAGHSESFVQAPHLVRLVGKSTYMKVDAQPGSSGYANR
jgi:chemotaxis protein methyltransferase CheR